MSTSENKTTDVIIAAQKRVSCDGGGGALGHPKTYLDMGTGTEVTCKYCGLVYQLDENAKSGGH